MNAPLADFAWSFDTTYLSLPEMFYRRLGPTSVRAPQMVIFNRGLAAEMGLDPDAVEEDQAAQLFSGNRLPTGASPFAQAYAGHQFGGFTMLGDGRAVVLGEHVTPDGTRLDVQFKGSGPTPFSRRGDGRAALGPMLREFIISEGMYFLGIPTTRSLAVAATGEAVYRDSIQAGAVLTRVADSHIRVGTFQYASAKDEGAGLPDLARYTINRHFPQAREADVPALALLRAVVDRQIDLIVDWMRVGFVHGVMNTDNMALSGETIDYGPCAFMEAYDPATVFSSIDQYGRYAFGKQPMMAQWNLARFAETLLPILAAEQKSAIALAEEEIVAFQPRFEERWRAMMARKLGLDTLQDGDDRLIQDLLAWMQGAQADYTRTFRLLTDSLTRPEKASGTVEDSRPVDARYQDASFRAWQQRWQTRVQAQHGGEQVAWALMGRTNPVYIPRNDRVEDALHSADEGDLAPLHRLLDVLSAPYERRAGLEAFEQPAPVDGPRYRTFCGT